MIAKALGFLKSPAEAALNKNGAAESLAQLQARDESTRRARADFAKNRPILREALLLLRVPAAARPRFLRPKPP
jgi:hypothetical protein